MSIIKKYQFSIASTSIFLFFSGLIYIWYLFDPCEDVPCWDFRPLISIACALVAPIVGFIIFLFEYFTNKNNGV